MQLPRIHLFEWEDQPWFPAVWRDAMTDYLRRVEAKFQFHRHGLKPLQRLINQTGARRIVDLCSGAGGPLPAMLRALAHDDHQVTAVLTDLYPNVDSLEQMAADSGGLVEVFSESVDATSVPAELTGLRTICNGLHHFQPPKAREILSDAVLAGEPIAVFEIAERRLGAILPLVLIPLIVLVMTPSIRPFRWSRLVWTYLIPVIPAAIQWDGVVSHLRAYTPAELLELARGADGEEQYSWESGYSRADGVPGRMTFLLGNRR